MSDGGSDERTVVELRARVSLGTGTATLLLVVAPLDEMLEEVRQLVTAAVSSEREPVEVVDLGTRGSDSGPADWVEATQERPAGAYVLSFVPSTSLETAAFAKRVNAERGLLRGLAGPVVLVVSRQTERVLRRLGHDFVTWVAKSYEVHEPTVLRAAVRQQGGTMTEPAVPVITEDPVRFLHISDLHLRPERVQRYDQDRVLRGLLDRLERERSSVPLDLVFVTGDLGAKGQPKEYALVVTMLRRLLEVTGLDPSRLFVVPGNHDVDRRVGRWLRRTLEPDDADAFFVEPDARRFHRTKLEAYEHGMRELLGAGRNLGLEVGAEAVERVEIRGTRLAVTSFNSAWFCQDDGDRGRLWLGEPNVERAVERVGELDVELSIALLHHPFEFLHEHERAVVERWCERGFDLVLRGHLHERRTHAIATQRGGYVEVAAPATYQGSQWGNGCFLGEIRPRARTVRLHPLTYASGPDPWVLDATVFPDDAEDGYIRTFTVPSTSRRRGGASPAMRGAVKEAYKKAPRRHKALVQEATRAVSPAPTRGMVYAEPEEELDEREATLALTESPSLRWEVLREDPGVALIEAIEAQPRAQLPIDDVEDFEHALLQAGRRLHDALQALDTPREHISEQALSRGLAAALTAVSGRSVTLDARLPGGRCVDIVVGSSKDRDFIEVTREHGEQALQVALARLDRHLQEGPGRLGAVVVLSANAGPLASERQEPSAGRPLLVVRL